MDQLANAIQISGLQFAPKPEGQDLLDDPTVIELYLGTLAESGLAGAALLLLIMLATVRGIGQSVARLGEVVSGTRTDPLKLNVFASALLPVAKRPQDAITAFREA